MPKKEYTLVYSSRFKKDFKSLSSDTQESVIICCTDILEDPFFKIRKLSGLKIGRLRKRIGDYRIRYDVFGNDVVLYSVKHRKDIYKKKEILRIKE